MTLATCTLGGCAAVAAGALLVSQPDTRTTKHAHRRTSGSALCFPGRQPRESAKYRAAVLEMYSLNRIAFSFGVSLRLARNADCGLQKPPLIAILISIYGRCLSGMFLPAIL